MSFMITSFFTSFTNLILSLVFIFLVTMSLKFSSRAFRSSLSLSSFPSKAVLLNTFFSLSND